MIYDGIRNQAHLRGDLPAVTFFDESITYGELESLSNRLAGLLISAGLKPGERVGLLMDKTPEAIAAMLGVSKAGGVYVPLDFRSPPGRVGRISRTSDLSFMMADQHALSHFSALCSLDSGISGIPWIFWEADAETQSVILNDRDDNIKRPVFVYSDAKSQPDVSHAVIRDEQAPAHILFTSGSTGQPKGVVITHKNITSFVNWGVPYFDIQPGERVSCHSPLHFDLSTFDIYGAFEAGAHIYPVPLDFGVIPQKLISFILDNELEQWFSVPSVLSYLAKFRAIPEGGFPRLKRLIWCGEVFPVPALCYWMDQLPDVTFTNLYGPTEATIASSYYTVAEKPDTEKDIPIGKPCAGEDLLVLDKELRPVKENETGDLYISGDGLSPGYWRDDEKTTSVFIEWTRADGTKERIYKTGDLASVDGEGLLHFHGRSDYQIKSRGYRIELGEIEAAMGQVTFLREYAVVPVNKEGFEGTAIGCAYVTAGIKDNKIPPRLKQILSEKLPKYMIPQYWLESPKLPRNGNGKIDRKKISFLFEEK